MKKHLQNGLLGFSDISTILTAFTCKLGWATAHGTNLMQLHNGQTDPLTRTTLDPLYLSVGHCFTQQNSPYYEGQVSDMIAHPEQGFSLTQPTQWQLLNPQTKQTTSVSFSGPFNWWMPRYYAIIMRYQVFRLHRLH